MKWTGFQRLTCLTGVTHHKTHASFQSSSCHAVMNLQGWLKDWPLGALWDWPRVSTCPAFFFFPHSMRLNPLSWQRSGGRGRDGAGVGPKHTWCAQKCPVSPFVFLCTFILLSVFSAFILSNQHDWKVRFFVLGVCKSTALKLVVGANKWIWNLLWNLH